MHKTWIAIGLACALAGCGNENEDQGLGSRESAVLQVNPCTLTNNPMCTQLCVKRSLGYCVDHLATPPETPLLESRFVATGSPLGAVSIAYVASPASGQTKAVKMGTSGANNSLTTKLVSTGVPARTSTVAFNPFLDSDGSVFAGFGAGNNVQFRFGSASGIFDTDYAGRGGGLGAVTSGDGTLVRLTEKGATARVGGTWRPFVDWGAVTDRRISQFVTRHDATGRKLEGLAANLHDTITLDPIDGSTNLTRNVFGEGDLVTRVAFGGFDNRGDSFDFALLGVSASGLELATNVGFGLVYTTLERTVLTPGTFSDVGSDAGRVLWRSDRETPTVFRVDGSVTEFGILLTDAAPGTAAFACAIPKTIQGIDAFGLVVLTACGEFLRVRPDL